MRLPSARLIFLACGTWLVALGFYFAALRPAMLPEDLRFIGASTSDLDQVDPGLAAWLRRVFIVLGAFMAATGVLTLFTASHISGPNAWLLASLVIVGMLSVVTMSATNFAIDSDYKTLLLVPAVLCVAGT